MSVNEDVKFLQDFQRRFHQQVGSVLDAEFDAAEAVAVRVNQRLEGLDGILSWVLLSPLILFPLSCAVFFLSLMYLVTQLHFANRAVSDLNFLYLFAGPAAFLILWLIYGLDRWVSTGMDISRYVLRGCERLATSKDYSPVEALELTEADEGARSVRDLLASRAQEFRVFHLWFFRGAKDRAEAELEQREREDALKALRAVNQS